jgi:hypothetical protein
VPFDHTLEMLTSSAVTARLLASITGANMIESAGGGNLTKLRQSNSRYLTRDRECPENRHGRARAKVIICKRAAIVIALKAFNKPEKSTEQTDDLPRLLVCSTNASDLDFMRAFDVAH